MTYCAKPLVIALVAGLCASAPAQDTGSNPTPIPRFVKGVPIAQIHINLSTGERSVVPWDARPRGAGASNPVWINNNTDPCLTGMTVGLIDDPDVNGDGFGDLFNSLCDGGTFPCEGSWNNWWGDLHDPDTVVDRLRFMYGTGIPDVDLDSDGVGDGVPGFTLFLNFADHDNGFGAHVPGYERQCIIELEITDLPGQAGALPPGFGAVYELVIDLGQDSPSLVFELGDSDGIDDAGTGFSGGAIYGAPTFADLDGDTKHDFSWGVRFDISSIPQAQRGFTGFVVSAVKLNSPGDSPRHPADAIGLFDGFDIYSSGPSCPPDRLTPHIFTGHGHFSCATGTPYASSHLELYGTPGEPSCTVADPAEPLGELNFADVVFFLQSAGTNSDYARGFAPPIFVFDFADVLSFLEYFNEGCW